jgi:hypothetical protein
MKVESAMQNKQIDGLVTNHSPTLCPNKNECGFWMLRKWNSSSKINLKDVL